MMPKAASTDPPPQGNCTSVGKPVSHLPVNIYSQDGFASKAHHVACRKVCESLS